MSRIHLILLLLLASLVQHVLSTDVSIDAPGDNKENQSYREKAKELASRISSALATYVSGYAVLCFVPLMLIFGVQGVLKTFAVILHFLAATLEIGASLVSLARSAGPGGALGVTFIIVAWYYFGG